VKGIGFVKACQIKATFELMKRTASYSEEEHPQITSTDDVIKLLAPHIKYLKQEEFRVLLLDSKKRLIRCQTVSLGSLDKALVVQNPLSWCTIIHQEILLPLRMIYS